MSIGSEEDVVVGVVGVGVIEHRGETSSRMRYESTQVSGLCFRIESVTTHLEDQLTPNAKRHMRPNKTNILCIISDEISRAHTHTRDDII